MKYINFAILVLGLLIGAIIGYNIPLGNGNAALIGALLLPALGFLIAFFIRKLYRTVSLEEREQQNRLAHQHYVATDSHTAELRLFIAEKFHRK